MGKNGENAVNAYKKKMKDSGKIVSVEKVGLVVIDQYPRLAASVDGKVFDKSVDSFGYLEVKWPISRSVLKLEEAALKQSFCLKKNDQGLIQMNPIHDYFHKVQGRMFVTGLKWTDFVVWLIDQVHIERSHLMKMCGMQFHYKCTKIEKKNFYQQMFVPELLTRQVDRN